MKLPSTRQLKVGQEIKSILSEIFIKQDIYDPKTFQIMEVTISEVQVSPDLRNATVFFTPLAGKGKNTAGEVLNSMAGKMKGEIGKRMHIKRIPSLFFKLDESFEKAGKLNDIIYQTKDKN